MRFAMTLALAGSLAALALAVTPATAAGPSLCDPIGEWYCVQPVVGDPEGNHCAARVQTYLVHHYVGCTGSDGTCPYSFTDTDPTNPPLYSYTCVMVQQGGCHVGARLYEDSSVYQCF